MDGYITLKNRAETEFTEKRSVFIGNAAPVKTEAEALSFLSEIKKRYSDARHHVYAYVLRENNTARFSDDGEPKGTGGMPTLETLKKNNVTDAIVVVTRYFGGILLGASGLTRAYTTGAAMAVAAAGIAEYRMIVTYRLTAAFRDGDRMRYLLNTAGCRIDRVDYGTEVTVTFSVLPEDEEDILKKLRDASAGRARVTRLSSEPGIWEGEGTPEA